MSHQEINMSNQGTHEVGPIPDPNPNPNPCPICLGPFNQEAYLDRCFHKFCYQCIVRWTEVVSSRSSSRKESSVKCPLCKTDNLSIIYGYDGSTFQRHYINQNNGNSTFFSNSHKYRLQSYYTTPDLLSETFKVGRYWKSRKYLQPNKWLETWLRRELQALIQSIFMYRQIGSTVQEEDVEIIMHHILGVIQSFSRSHYPRGTPYTPELKQKEFRGMVGDAARPFLTARADRFVDEVELFLASCMTIEAYDEAYKGCLGWQKPKEISKGEETSARERQAVPSYLYLFDDDNLDEPVWEEDVI